MSNTKNHKFDNVIEKVRIFRGPNWCHLLTLKQPPFLNQSQRLAQDCSTVLAHVTPGKKIYPRQRHPSFAGKRFLPCNCLSTISGPISIPGCLTYELCFIFLRETKHGLNILVVKVNIDQGYLEKYSFVFAFQVMFYFLPWDKSPSHHHLGTICSNHFKQF